LPGGDNILPGSIQSYHAVLRTRCVKFTLKDHPNA